MRRAGAAWRRVPPLSDRLGQASAHALAEHGGTIVAESSEENGTVFSARLPRSQADLRPSAVSR